MRSAATASTPQVTHHEFWSGLQAPAEDRRLGAPVDADGHDVSVGDDRSPCHEKGAAGCHIQDLGAPRGTAEFGYTEDDVPALVKGASSSDVCSLSRHATRAPTTRAIILSASITNW
jgi:hypothetical protein